MAEPPDDLDFGAGGRHERGVAAQSDLLPEVAAVGERPAESGDRRAQERAAEVGRVEKGEARGDGVQPRGAVAAHPGGQGGRAADAEAGGGHRVEIHGRRLARERPQPGAQTPDLAAAAVPDRVVDVAGPIWRGAVGVRRGDERASGAGAGAGGAGHDGAGQPGRQRHARQR